MFKNTEDLGKDLSPHIHGLFHRLVAQAITEGLYGGLACGGTRGRDAFLIEAGPAFDAWFEGAAEQLSTLLAGDAAPGIPAALLVEEPELCAFLMGNRGKGRKAPPRKKTAPERKHAAVSGDARTPSSPPAALTPAPMPAVTPVQPVQVGPAPASLPSSPQRDEPAA